MTGPIGTLARSSFKLWNVAGLPSSGPYEPDKQVDLWPLFDLIDSQKLDAQLKVWADSLSRSMYDRFADMISLAEAPTYATDLGAAINWAMGKARAGSLIYVPPTASGAALTWSTAATISSGVVLDLGQVEISIVGAITALSVTGMYTRVQGGYVHGTRTSGQKFIYTTAFQPTFRSMRIEQVDIGVHQNGGYRPRIENIQFRNIVSVCIWAQDGVGPDILGCGNDTDGTWYGGSYAPPTRGIWLQTEGCFIDRVDFIHSGIGLDIDVSGSRNIEWGLVMNSYFDSCVGNPGIRIRNTSGTYYCRGIFFCNVWSATGSIGMLITGSGNIDGIYGVGCIFHNNTSEGIRNEAPNAYNIVMDCPRILGNNAGGGTANAVYSAGAGRLSIRNGQFGRQSKWTAKVYYYIYADTAQSSDIDVGGSFFDPGGFNAGGFYKAGSAAILLHGVTGIITRKRGKSTIPSGSTSISVAPGLGVPWADKHVMISAATGAFGWTDGLTDTPGTSNFTINIASSVGFGADFIWDVNVDQI